MLRGADLVVLDVLCFNIELIHDGGPVLHALDRARLEVRFTFQHAAEQVAIEVEGPQPPLPPIPVGARAARGSRLVYTVPAGTRIEYSTAGVLAALSRLELNVVPLALPRAAERLSPRGLADLPRAVALPGELQLLRARDGLVLARDARPGRSETQTGPGALIAAATALRTARTLLLSESARNLSGYTFDDARRGAGTIAGLVEVSEAFRPRRARPRAPRADETAIEAPYRLILSPSSLGGFSHAAEPRVVLGKTGQPDRVELWHSRLGVRKVDANGSVTIDETPQSQKAVRAVWTRDSDVPGPGAEPFAWSLTQENREALVRQSSDPELAVPQPVSADRLYLSALGAWLDLHGRWDTGPYSAPPGHPSVTSWDHEATEGRDQYVRVEQPYYLFPTGHKCAVVSLTERKVKETVAPQARLYKRTFIVVQEPVRTYDDRAMPFIQVRIRPLVTPNLDPTGSHVPPFGADVFWPTVGGQKFRFVLDCLDHDGRRVILRAPLLAVAERRGSPGEKSFIRAAYQAAGPIPADGQSIAMAQSIKPGDTAFETRTLSMSGEPGDPPSRTSTPRLAEADIVVPAMRHLSSNSDSVKVKYAAPYLKSGFTGNNSSSQVLLELTTMTSVTFGGGTDRSGGFVQPDLPIRGLSRAFGLVGDSVMVTNPVAGGGFDPAKFLDGVAPKLFGLISLVDILDAAGLDAAPKFVTEQLDKVGALLRDLNGLREAVKRGVERLDDDAATAATTKLQAQAEAARAELAAVAAELASKVDDIHDTLEALMAIDAPSDLATVTAALGGLPADTGALIKKVDSAVKTIPMPTAIRSELERLVLVLSPLLDVAHVAETITSITDFVNGVDPADPSVRAAFDWRPSMRNLPATALTEDQALFFVAKDGFRLSVEARASGRDGVGFEALAELSDFGLNLFPDEPLMKLRFDRLGFRAGSGSKPEVDVVFTGLEWCGYLSFISTLQELIPFDGFSDPPYVDVSPTGVTAGFDLALPSVAVGVFSLENISLGADVRVPFLGEALTVGFNFCTRERPFRLTVMCIGGGGFVGMRLSPKGLVLLEMALEATACLSVDLVVASGSVSVSIGLYLRLESEKGSLTGYFRIRGEVDVLGLISASITLELSLTYEFDTGKMVGRASISLEVEVFLFSFSVEVSCERRLAGSNGDPTFADFLGISADGTPLVTVPSEWSDYCAAFTGA